MPSKPVHFDGQDLRVVASGDLDPAVLPSTVVLTDGSKPFIAPQPGVAPAADAHLTTRAWVQANQGSRLWQGAVISLVAVLPGSPATGDRHILTTTNAINQWSGSAWVATSAAPGMTAYVTGVDTIARYSGLTSTWGDISELIDHAALDNLQGGTSGERYHLTAAKHTELTAAGAARKVLATPAAGGVPVLRDLTAADLISGQVASARGGTGLDSSAATGYAKATAGTWSFSTTIAWGDISGAPGSFAPAAHKVSHQIGGADQLGLDGSQITSGLVPAVRGGTGVAGNAVAARRFLASPTGALGAVSYRALDVDDIPGATAAGQVLRRNAGNTGNEWFLLDAAELGAVPTDRQILTPGYLTGGGALSSNLTLEWGGVDVLASGTLVGRRPKLNIVGATTVDNPGQNRVDVTLTVGIDPLVAAIVLG